MTEEEFAAEMRAALERALLNPDYPVIKTTEEADALADRGMQKLWGLLLGELTPAIAAGEYLDQWQMDHEWRGPMGAETTAPPDDTKPRENHVRDAVQANR